MLRHVVGDLDPGGDGVSSSNGRVARVDRCAVDADAAALSELLASEPVIAVTSITLVAVRAVATLLAIDIGAREHTSLEALLGLLLLREGRQVVGVQELVDEFLVLADAVREHAAVVAVVVDAPLDLNGFTGAVCRDGLFAPVGAWLVVVDADPGVVSAGPGAIDHGLVQVGPCMNRLEDSTLRAGIWAGLAEAVSG